MVHDFYYYRPQEGTVVTPVCLSTVGGEVDMYHFLLRTAPPPPTAPSPGQHPPFPDRTIPPSTVPSPGQQAGGTHPIRLLSC